MDFEKAILNFLLDKDAGCDGLKNYLSKPGLDYILKYAKANHLLFAFASKLEEEKCLDGNALSQIKQVLQEENSRYSEMASLAKQAQNIFNENQQEPR